MDKLSVDMEQVREIGHPQLLGLDADVLATSEAAEGENGSEANNLDSTAGTGNEMVLESAVNAPIIGDTPVKRKKKSKGQRGIVRKHSI